RSCGPPASRRASPPAPRTPTGGTAAAPPWFGSRGPPPRAPAAAGPSARSARSASAAPRSPPKTRIPPPATPAARSPASLHFHRIHQAGDRRAHLVPPPALRLQLPLARRRQPVELGPLIVFGQAPL